MSFDLKQYLKQRKQEVESALEQYLPQERQWPERLHESMLYSIRAGGKRLRPILALAACEAVGGSMNRVMPIAAALEMIHTYSLIHDDLPAMDDDDLRRGKPTNHKIYGEAMAILAGDALLTEAFRIMAKHRHPQVDPVVLIEVIEQIADASGSQGMAGGQVVDLESEKKHITLSELERLHQHKTGRLIRVSVEAGARLGGGSSEQVKALGLYGEKIGLAFQIADDVLDIEGGEEIGKDIGSDLEKEKSTYPRLMGIEESKRRAALLIEESIQLLNPFGESAQPLREIARYVVSRKS
ncbi:MAG: polyprenyl synthetase family protein [Deltaproteobacteria bacterium]|nr:polyprenyl synthetase family protein [Deltaproteobacteria bacterium]